MPRHACVCVRVCVGQKMTWGSQFSPYTMWVPRMEFGSVRLGNPCLDPPIHFISPCF